jgi:Microtubule-associated protein 70
MLREDNKALERATKSKEAALVEAGNILRSALERALIVEDVQNKNFELRRQIEIYQVPFFLLIQQISLNESDICNRLCDQH